MDIGINANAAIWLGRQAQDHASHRFLFRLDDGPNGDVTTSRNYAHPELSYQPPLTGELNRF